MKVPTELSLDQYRELNEICLDYRGKRWTQLTMAECDDLLQEINQEVAALEERIAELNASRTEELESTAEIPQFSINAKDAS